MTNCLPLYVQLVLAAAVLGASAILIKEAMHLFPVVNALPDTSISKPLANATILLFVIGIIGLDVFAIHSLLVKAPCQLPGQPSEPNRKIEDAHNPVLAVAPRESQWDDQCHVNAATQRPFDFCFVALSTVGVEKALPQGKRSVVAGDSEIRVPRELKLRRV